MTLEREHRIHLEESMWRIRCALNSESCAKAKHALRKAMEHLQFALVLYGSHIVDVTPSRPLSLVTDDDGKQL
jgi:hypothetical protein